MPKAAASDAAKIAASETTEAAPTASAPRPGFSKEGKPYPGVDPETGERKAVTLDGLKREFGPRRGEELYRELAQAGGHGFVEGSPALSLVDMDEEHGAKVKKVLANAEKE